MSNVYMFQAALLCEDCGLAIRQSITDEGKAPEDIDDESSYDSDEFPKGPYYDGGGEADSPNHCDDCRAFLENPLTDEGYQYVTQAIIDHNKTGRGNSDVINEWKAFYDISIDSDDDQE